MNIMIAGSSSFAKEMVDYKRQLELMGHTNNLHEHYIAQGNGQMKDLVNRMQREHGSVKRQYSYIKYHFKEIEDCDAMLVLNFDRKGIKNYIGANTFLEIGQAYCLNKKIFLLNEVPDQEYIKDEIEAIDPTVIYGDLKKIK